MTKEQYKKHINDIEEESSRKTRAVNYRYIKENAKYIKGDIITSYDEVTTIKIEEITYSLWEEYPAVIYVGYRLNKKLVLPKVLTIAHVPEKAVLKLIKKKS